MTLGEMTRPANDPSPALPPRRLGRRLAIGAAIILLLVAGGVTALTYYYDSVPLPEDKISYPVAELPSPVANAFVAAVDPDFYGSSDSLITRRYAVLAADGGEVSSWRTRIMAHKAEAAYSKTEILNRYLTRAGYGRGAVGVVAAAQTYFHKPATQLTVAEAAFLAVQLHPGHPEPKAGWARVLDTMVERGWLTRAERNGLRFPA
jgi:hypothetical protein